MLVMISLFIKGKHLLQENKKKYLNLCVICHFWKNMNYLPRGQLIFWVYDYREGVFVHVSSMALIFSWLVPAEHCGLFSVITDWWHSSAMISLTAPSIIIHYTKMHRRMAVSKILTFTNRFLDLCYSFVLLQYCVVSLFHHSLQFNSTLCWIR